VRHLFSSRVRVERLQFTDVNGRRRNSWVVQPGILSNFACRLDLNFLRPGKDQPQAIEAGRAPDRIGVLFCGAEVPLQAGDRIVTLSGPVQGVFEILVVPDVAVAFSTGHHKEVQIVETNQNTANFPSSAAPETDAPVEDSNHPGLYKAPRLIEDPVHPGLYMMEGTDG